MVFFYLFCLVVGGGLLSLSLFSDTLETELDPGAQGLNLLSLRSAIYFLFTFGGVGAVLTWSGSLQVFALLAAAAAGVFVATLASAAFAYLRRSDSGQHEPTEAAFVGLPARVTVPVTHRGPGKVVVQRGERTFELIARPHAADAPEPHAWSAVVVVEMRNGVALVAPVDARLGLAPAESSVE